MLKIIDDLPEYVFGLRAIGDVSGDEIKECFECLVLKP
jgi:hypothetical protein